VPALPSCIQEPRWDRFIALLPTRQVHHPRLPPPPGSRPRHLRQAHPDPGLGCGYRRIADHPCSAATLRRRRDEGIALGVADQRHRLALAAYDRLHGLELEHLAVDGCITKAPCGGQVAGPGPVDRRQQGCNDRSPPKPMDAPDRAAGPGQPPQATGCWPRPWRPRR
jgi:hypothetical protein